MVDLSQLTPEQRKQLEDKMSQMSPEEVLSLQKQQCVFCNLAAGKISPKKVYEDHFCIVILDINPAAKGHLLIIPKEHYSIMPQVPDKIIAHLFSIAQSYSLVLLKKLKVGGTNLLIGNGFVAGQRIPHFFLHLIPRKNGDQVLNLKEKIIDHETVLKVKAVVEPKMVTALKPQLVIGNNESVDPNFLKEKTVKTKEESKNVKKTKKAVKSKDSTVSARKKKTKVTAKAGTQPFPVEEEIDQGQKFIDKKRQEQLAQQRKETEANLDEIANLFR